MRGVEEENCGVQEERGDPNESEEKKPRESIIIGR